MRKISGSTDKFITRWNADSRRQSATNLLDEFTALRWTGQASILLRSNRFSFSITRYREVRS